MKEFINKIVNNQQVNINELNTFIIDYCKLMGSKIPTAEELPIIVQMIQMNTFISGQKNTWMKTQTMEVNLTIQPWTQNTA